MCTVKDKILERWREHFESVLNTISTFNEEVVSKQVQLPLREHMSEPPTEKEIMEAIDHVKRNKAGGSSGILLKTCGANIIEYIKDLFETVWHEGVPQEWKDATLIPIPKKGDLSQCDNWRGISLLDVFGESLGEGHPNKTTGCSRGSGPRLPLWFRTWERLY